MLSCPASYGTCCDGCLLRQQAAIADKQARDGLTQG